MTVKPGQIWLDNYRYAMSKRYVKVLAVDGDRVTIHTCTLTGDLITGKMRLRTTKLGRFNEKTDGFSLIVDL